MAWARIDFNKYKYCMLPLVLSGFANSRFWIMSNYHASEGQAFLHGTTIMKK